MDGTAAGATHNQTGFFLRRSLDLWSGFFTGGIPAELGNLANSQVLRLDKNKLTGRIPVELMDMTSLLSLNICDNNLCATDPELRDFPDNLQPDWEDCQTRPMPWVPL